MFRPLCSRFALATQTIRTMLEEAAKEDQNMHGSSHDHEADADQALSQAQQREPRYDDSVYDKVARKFLLREGYEAFGFDRTASGGSNNDFSSTSTLNSYLPDSSVSGRTSPTFSFSIRPSSPMMRFARSPGGSPTGPQRKLKGSQSPNFRQARLSQGSFSSRRKMSRIPSFGALSRNIQSDMNKVLPSDTPPDDGEDVHTLVASSRLRAHSDGDKRPAPLLATFSAGRRPATVEIETPDSAEAETSPPTSSFHIDMRQVQARLQVIAPSHRYEASKSNSYEENSSQSQESSSPLFGVSVRRDSKSAGTDNFFSRTSSNSDASDNYYRPRLVAPNCTQEEGFDDVQVSMMASSSLNWDTNDASEDQRATTIEKSIPVTNVEYQDEESQPVLERGSRDDSSKHSSLINGHSNTSFHGASEFDQFARGLTPKVNAKPITSRTFDQFACGWIPRVKAKLTTSRT